MVARSVDGRRGAAHRARRGAVERQVPKGTTDRGVEPGSRGWQLVFASGLVAVVLVTLLGGRAHDVGSVATTLGAAGAAVIPRLRLQSPVPTSIVGLGAGLAAIGLGDAASTANRWSGGAPFPSAADVAYLSGYGILGLAIARWYGRWPTPARFVDAAIVTVAGTLVLWVVAIEPAVGLRGTIVATSIALAYPAVDLLALGLLAGLLVEPRTRSASLGFGFAAIACLLVADTVYAHHARSDTDGAGLLDALRLAGYVLLATAANHPSLLVEGPTTPPGVGIGRGRLAGLLVAALTAPVIVAVRWAAGGQIDPIVASLGAGVLISLVFVRLGVAGQTFQATIASLSAADTRVRRLEGILPICATCKRIRDEEGRWTAVERFLEDRSPARFSHGLCDDCLRDQLRTLE